MTPQQAEQRYYTRHLFPVYLHKLELLSAVLCIVFSLRVRSPCKWPLGFMPHRVKMSQGICSHVPTVIKRNQRLHDWQCESQQAGERPNTLDARSRWGEGKSRKKPPLVFQASSFDAWVSRRLSHRDMPYWLQRIPNMERERKKLLKACFTLDI